MSYLANLLGEVGKPVDEQFAKAAASSTARPSAPAAATAKSTGTTPLMESHQNDEFLFTSDNAKGSAFRPKAIPRKRAPRDPGTGPAPAAPMPRASDASRDDPGRFTSPLSAVASIN